MDPPRRRAMSAGHTGVYARQQQLETRGEEPARRHRLRAWSVHDLRAFERATSPEMMHQFFDEIFAPPPTRLKKVLPGSFVDGQCE